MKAELFALDRAKVLAAALVAASVVLASLPQSLVDPARCWLQGPVVRLTSSLQEATGLVAPPGSSDALDPQISEEIKQREAILQAQITELQQRLQALETFRGTPLAQAGQAVSADIVMTQWARPTLGPAGLWGDGLMLNKGTRDNVAVDDVVVVPLPGFTEAAARTSELAGYFLLGKITAAGPLSSRVELLTDKQFRCSVKIMDTQPLAVRSRGIAAGTNQDDLSIQYVDIRHDVRPDQLVVSDGKDGLFPAGLVVGRVAAVTNRTADGFKDVDVAPAVKVEKLDWVMVVRRQQVPPPEKGK
jgi:rod shape-determining protein MreC